MNKICRVCNYSEYEIITITLSYYALIIMLFLWISGVEKRNGIFTSLLNSYLGTLFLILLFFTLFIILKRQNKSIKDATDKVIDKMARLVVPIEQLPNWLYNIIYKISLLYRYPMSLFFKYLGIRMTKCCYEETHKDHYDVNTRHQKYDDIGTEQQRTNLTHEEI